MVRPKERQSGVKFEFPGLVYPDERDVRFLARSPSQARRPDGTYHGWDDRMLLREFRCLWDEGVITAPAGFIFDGSSITPAAQSLFQKNGSWARPSITHDWLYANRLHSREFADDLLEAGLIAAGTPAWGRFWFMKAVRAFGQAAWEDDH
jgi:hypothetical protein